MSRNELEEKGKKKDMLRQVLQTAKKSQSRQ
jgi:hypothetical protein